MGNGLSQLTEEQITKLKETTPFDEADMVKLLKRYSQYDETEKGTDGIPYHKMMAFPELQANPIVPRLLQLFVNRGNRAIYPEKFLYFFSILNRKTKIRDKRKAAFQCFDTSGRGVLGRQDVYAMFALLYRGSVNEDFLLDLTDRVFSQPHLENPDYITRDEFDRMISDWEISQLFTIELQTG